MLLKVSFSFTLSKAEDRISGLMQPLILHILKVKLHPENSNVNHWKNEIYAWLAQIQGTALNVKTKTGKVKVETLTKWMLGFANIRELTIGTKLVKRLLGYSSVEINIEEFQVLIQVIAKNILDEKEPEELLDIIFPCRRI